MNKKLYLPILLLMFGLGVHTSHELIEIFNLFLTKQDKSFVTQNHYPLNLSLKATNIEKAGIMMFNMNDQDELPTTIRECRVYIEKDTAGIGFRLSIILLLLVTTIAVITCIICFVKIITSFSRNEIYEWKNIKWLRYIGIGFIAIFITYIGVEHLLYLKAKELIEIPGYQLSTIKIGDISYLIFGITSLIIAEIFAIGLRLKEDEELTI